MILNIAAPGLSWGQIVCSDHWSVLQSSNPQQLKLLSKTTSQCFHSSVHWTVKSLVKCCRPLELIIIFFVLFYSDSALICLWLQCSGLQWCPAVPQSRPECGTCEHRNPGHPWSVTSTGRTPAVSVILYKSGQPQSSLSVSHNIISRWEAHSNMAHFF